MTEAGGAHRNIPPIEEAEILEPQPGPTPGEIGHAAVTAAVTGVSNKADKIHATVGKIAERLGIKADDDSKPKPIDGYDIASLTRMFRDPTYTQVNNRAKVTINGKEYEILLPYGTGKDGSLVYLNNVGPLGFAVRFDAKGKPTIVHRPEMTRTDKKYRRTGAIMPATGATGNPVLAFSRAKPGLPQRGNESRRTYREKVLGRRPARLPGEGWLAYRRRTRNAIEGGIPLLYDLSDSDRTRENNDVVRRRERIRLRGTSVSPYSEGRPEGEVWPNTLTRDEHGNVTLRRHPLLM